ncbi:small integral membrane protein 4 [Folsomia candida]|uniref:small integral membrane protein 4 n=1 Tax=Folsomia candida TaxID=158441 RepID=UPI000B8F9050|nr:small integral membrane protein 4 [Folsomia candida]
MGGRRVTRLPWIRRVLDRIPGNNRLGMYRFLPFFFVLGAALEFSMIKWDVNGQVNFYRTYKRRRAEEVAAAITHSVQGPEVNN